MLSRDRRQWLDRQLLAGCAAALAVGFGTPGLCLAQEPTTMETAPPTAGAEAGKADATQQPWLRGQLRSRFVFRATGDDEDSDLIETLSLDAGHAATDRITAHLMGRLSWDMDGSSESFASINDSYGDRVDGLLYDAWVDIHRVGGLSLLRLGRQSTIDTPIYAYFDGGHVASEEFGSLKLQVGGYVGVSTHLYEASHSGDLTSGLYAQVRPWTGGRLRLDWMHLEDERRLGTYDDDVLGAAFWQHVCREVRLESKYSSVGGESRDAQARLNWTSPEYGAFVQGSFYTLFKPQGDLVLEADPYFQQLNELFPYDQWSILAAKDLCKSVRLQLATDLRRVQDAGDIGFYNRDYDHYYATASLFEFGVKGLRLSATCDLWDSTGQDITSFGGDASYEMGETTVSGGTYYSLYKFDLFSNSERDHVRTWFLRLRHKASASMTFDGDYEYEDNDFDQYNRFRLGVTWRF